MNCKKGDLAIAVKSVAGNEGKIMTCIRYIGSVEGYFGSDYWEVDLSTPSKYGKNNRIYRDSWLRPIRNPGDDAKDETLEWLPVPSKQKETA